MADPPGPFATASRRTPATAISERKIWLIAAALIAADLALFMVPVVPFVVAYVLIARPPWFKDFVDDLYDGTSDTGESSGADR
jgi:hypothetical protein